MSTPNLLSLFRASMEEDDESIDENFQTANMIHKLKQTKENRKKRKGNYKNIEEFETITNTETDEDRDISATESFKEGIDEEDYTNEDYVEDPDRIEITSMKIEEHVEKVFDNATNGPRTIAQIFCKAFTGGKATKEDEDLIHGYIMWILTAIISLYVVYNWYFVMFYAPKNSIDLMHVTREYFEEKQGDNDFYKVLLYLFDIAIWFPEMLDKLMTQYVPAGMNKLFNGSMKFIVLYYFFIYFNYNAVSWIKDELIQLFTGGASIFWSLLVVVLVLFILSIANNTEVLDKPLFVVIPYYLIRLIIVFIVSIPVGIFMSTIYWIFNSFFAKKWYSNRTLWSSIDAFVENDKSPLENLTSCDIDEETGFFVRFAISLFTFAREFKHHLIWATLFGMFVYSAITMYQDLSPVKSVFPNLLFRDSMMLYNLMFAISMGSIIFARIRKRKLSEMDI